MNVAMRALPGSYRVDPASDSQIARVEIFDDLPAAEPHWRALEHEQALTSPYQRYDLLSLWQHHVGEASGVTPFIVVAFNAGRAPLFLWPLGARTLAGFRVVEFLCGKHANFNMALWRRDAAAKIGADDLHGGLAPPA